MRANNVVDLNDRLVVTPVSKVEEKMDDSKDVKDMKDASSADPVSANPAKDHSSTEVNVPPFSVDDVPFPPFVNDDAFQWDKTIVNIV